ncbi:hypothetical protein KFE25_002027 [Diacronema lutheri]|uniref:Uncharacterized protein n=1 Tax=Diacronema lutheri TaxID=2081491 RepID=A0A8J5XCQ8_DIALT|nr:hypothetical protein KFE25_002027 [Diacronema lutheri]
MPGADGDSVAPSVHLADFELSRLERDYLATINAKPIDRSPLAPARDDDGGDDDGGGGGGGDCDGSDGGRGGDDAPRAGEGDGGYEALGDEDVLSGDDEADEAPGATGEPEARAPVVGTEGECAGGGVAGRVPAVDAPVARAREVGNTGAGADEADAARADGSRDIALPADKRELIAGLMRGFEIKGAGEWSARFAAARSPP